jgi:hypothetical protein
MDLPLIKRVLVMEIQYLMKTQKGEKMSQAKTLRESKFGSLIPGSPRTDVTRKFPMKHALNIFISTFIPLLLSLLILTTFYKDVGAAEPSAFNSWAKTAKLGGAALYIGMTPEEIDQILSNMVAQKVTVIEADSDLSNYLTDAQFEQELSLMRSFVDAAHLRGLRVVWYYPSLEVVTVNGKNIEQTMAKEHPDWVQIGLDGTPNVFYGGSGQVFWVEENDESAWMSPSSPGYRNYFLNRVRKIVATGIDGLWVDVPIYADFGPTKWSDLNPAAMTKFLSDTGYAVPTAEDWNDPVWRRWIGWRHEEIAGFLSDVTSAARSINPEFPIFAQTLPTDYNGATIYGLEGSYLKNIEGLTHIWEVDTMSNNVGMRNAQEDDWISFISALKYTRAASGNKPSWVFNYGKQADDAELVMAEALAAGNNPYELKVPEMTTTVGVDYRTRMFGWAQKNSPYLFEAVSGAEVAVLHSSPSRDYVDKFQGLGMFVTWDSNDSLWWAEEPIDSAYARQYLAEYRGMVKLLVHEHIPFDSVVRPDLAELSSYEMVILPDIEAISDAEADILRQYVQNGGHLVVTGPNPTGLDEYGTARSEYALANVLGFGKSDPLPAETQNLYGAGSVRFYPPLLGKAYFVSSEASAHQTLSDAIRTTSTVPLTTNADRRVHFELSQLGEETILQFVNFIGVDGSFSVAPTTFSVSLDIPAGKQVTGVALTSPDSPNTPALDPIPYTASNQQVSFDVALDQYALVVVSFNEMTTNVPPTADAGAAQDVNGGDTVTLDGTGSSDPEGAIAAYKWEQIEGTSVTLSDSTASKPTFTAPNEDGRLSFRLTVTDAGGLTGTDSVIVTTHQLAGTNVPPTADAGAAQDVNGGDTVALDGTGSSDPEGSIAAYKWEQIEGTSVTLSDSTASKPTFTAPNEDGRLSFRLTVMDAGGLTGTDSVIVTTNQLAGNNGNNDGGGGSSSSGSSSSGGGCTLGKPGAVDPLFWLMILASLCWMRRRQRVRGDV